MIDYGNNTTITMVKIQGNNLIPSEYRAEMEITTVRIHFLKKFTK